MADVLSLSRARVWGRFSSAILEARFTKRLRGYPRDLPYVERLKRLNLEMLETRRIKSDLVMCYKIIFDIVHLNKHDFFSIGQY